MSELPIEKWDLGEAITGGITLLQASLANIQIKGAKEQYELRIETFQGNQEIVLGLNGIKRLFLCLDGLNNLMKIRF